ALVSPNRYAPDVHIERLPREYHPALVGDAGLHPHAVSGSDLQGLGGDVSRGQNFGSPQIRSGAIRQGEEDPSPFPVARPGATLGAKDGVLAQSATAAGALRLA